MNKLLAAMLTIGFAAAMVGTGTIAYFSDTEVSAGNTFIGPIPVDLKVDWVEYYNGEKIEEQPEIDNPDPIFELGDVKPGDYGEADISLHVYENRSFVSMVVTITSNEENGLTEPESKVDNTPVEGDLPEKIYVEIKLWYDANGNGVQDPGEIQDIYSGTLQDLDREIKELDGNPSTSERDPFEVCETYYVIFSWEIKGKDVGNEIQTDKCTFDISFTAEQEVS